MAISRICSIPDCGKPVYGFDCCRNHYRRLKLYNDPTGGGTYRGEPLRWLRQHADWSGPDCVYWPFGKSPNGYGSIKYRGAAMGAHRAMCFEAYGEPPTATHEAAHGCGKGSSGCVNPRHLRWATPQENVDDLVAHGVRKGEMAQKAILTEADVHRIRQMEGTMTQSEVGNLFGVSREAIAAIYSGRSWAWLQSTH